jgi:peptide/nickel transport system substrate-binding protein
MYQLLTDARLVSDEAGRTALYDAVQKLMAQDVPYIPLFQGEQQIAAKPEVAGVLLDPVQIFRYYLL